MSRTIPVTAAERQTIVTLYAAARRAFARRFGGGEETDAAAFVRAAWHATAAYRMKTPLARCAAVLGVDAAGAAGKLSAYREIEARAPDKCARAKADFVDFFRQTTGEDLSEFSR